jgi:polygalacturonase
MLFQYGSQIAYADAFNTLRSTSPTVPATASADGTYNVKDHGAVGNSATDDTSAIATAINAAASAGGGEVLLLLARLH